MGIVLGHILAATYFSYRDKNWFTAITTGVHDEVPLSPDLGPDWGPASRDLDPAARKRLLQELHQNLEVASDISELKTALEGVVSDLLPATSKICIYFKGISLNDGTDCNFQDQIIRRALNQKEQIISYPTDSNHPQSLSVSAEATWKTSNSVIICSPILGPQESDVFGIIIAVCDYFTEEQKRILQDIKYQRKMGCFKSRSRTISVPLEDAVITASILRKKFVISTMHLQYCLQICQHRAANYLFQTNMKQRQPKSSSHTSLAALTKGF